MSPSAELLALLGLSFASVAAGCRLASRPRRKRALAALGFALLGWPVVLNLWPYHLYFLSPAFPFGEVLFGHTPSRCSRSTTRRW